MTKLFALLILAALLLSSCVSVKDTLPEEDAGLSPSAVEETGKAETTEDTRASEEAEPFEAPEAVNDAPEEPAALQEAEGSVPGETVESSVEKPEYVSIPDAGPEEEEETIPEEPLPEIAAEEESGKDAIAFSGGASSVVLREGKERVELSEGAVVSVGSLTLEAQDIILSGSDWQFVECSGRVRVADEERGIYITTSSIWYDREDERILVSNWYEIEDRRNEVTASGAVLEYRMEEERLQLDKDVSLLKATDNGLMRCKAQSVVFSRRRNFLSLRGSATVDWKGNFYSAEVISVDLDTDTIILEGRIQGDING